MTATGAVRVACRSLSGGAGGLRRSIDNQVCVCCVCWRVPRDGHTT
jgi:hypothetical protein